MPAVFTIAIPFLIWDQYFTINGVWGFNETYLQGFFIGSLPLEEVLFFFLIPYCCVFIYEVLIAYFPNASLNKLTKIFSLIFVLSGTLLALMNLENWYPLCMLFGCFVCCFCDARKVYLVSKSSICFFSGNASLFNCQWCAHRSSDSRTNRLVFRVSYHRC